MNIYIFKFIDYKTANILAVFVANFFFIWYNFYSKEGV